MCFFLSVLFFFVFYNLSVFSFCLPICFLKRGKVRLGGFIDGEDLGGFGDAKPLSEYSK